MGPVVVISGEVEAEVANLYQVTDARRRVCRRGLELSLRECGKTAEESCEIRGLELEYWKAKVVCSGWREEFALLRRRLEGCL